MEKRLKVMIVDDEKDERDILSGNLLRRKKDLIVIQKENPALAVFHTKKEIPDVIITDINFYGSSESLGALLEVAQRFQIPVIVHSYAEWEKPINARGIVFMKKQDPSKEYYDHILETIFSLTRRKPKVNLTTEDIKRIERPKWHIADTKGKLGMILNRGNLTDHDKRILELRIKLIEAREALRLEALQNLSRKEMEARLTRHIKLSEQLEKVLKRHRPI